MADFLEQRGRGGGRGIVPGVTEEGRYERNYLSVYDLMTHTSDMVTDDLFQYSLVSVCVCECVCVWLCAHVHACIYICVCVCFCVHPCVCVCMRACVCACVCVYACMCMLSACLVLA